MNIGVKPDTIIKLQRVHDLVRRQQEPSVRAACKRVKISYPYYWKFPKKYPHLAKEAGYAAVDQ